MKIAEQNINLKEAIKRWDAGETVWSVERGGLGPGYEQAIQVGVFELAKIMLNDTLPKDNDELNKLFDKKLIDLIHTRKHPILKGLSGAQASAIKVLVYQFLSIGYEETLKDAKDYGVDLIQVEKNIPQSEIKVEVENEEGGVSVKITKEWLEEKEACVEGIEWFCSQKETDAVKLIKKLIRRGDKDSLDWANWSIVRVMTYKQYVSYAVYAVELVIDVYEEDYPDDDRPRKAIEAAKKCINEPTKENKEAARAAAWESKGEWAARAARDAALAAWEVEEKWTAWAAGMAAKAAGKETLLKILKHGLRLLKE